MNNKYSTSEIAEHLSKACNLPIPMSDNFLQEYFTIIVEGLIEDGFVEIDGLGTFKIIDVEKQQIANLENGTIQEIPQHKKIVFTAQDELAAAVNEPFAMFEPLILEEEKIKVEPIEEAALLYFEDKEPDALPLPIDIELSDKPIIGSLLQPELGDSEEDLDQLSIDFLNYIQQDKDETSIIDNNEEEKVYKENIQEEKACIENIEKEIDNSTENIEYTAVVSNPEDTQVSHIVENEEQTYTDEPKIILEDVIIDEDPASELSKNSAVKSNDIIVAIIIMFLVLVTTLTLMWFSGMFNNVISENEPLEETTEIETTKLDAPASTITHNTVPTNTDSIYKNTTENIVEDIAPALPKSDSKSNSSDITPIYETISKGVMLTTLAKKHYGNKFFWCYIYEENKSIIKNPNLIPLGTKLTIAPKSKYGIDPSNRESIEKAKVLCNKLSK
ncbi:MAG: HU family DNA-binding protein [Bacteroidales bacterium]